MLSIVVREPSSAQLHFDSAAFPALLLHNATRRHRTRGALSDLRCVERAADAAGAVAEDMGVDHGRGDVAVAEELLDGSDVVAAFEKMCGEECRKV
jgi:hypothetical protein